MKKAILLSLIFAMFISLFVPAFAVDFSGRQVPVSDDSDYVEEITALKERVLEIEDEISPRSGGCKNLNVPLIQQVEDYYCGPASMQMVLKFFGINKTQQELAKSTGTNQVNGTIVYNIWACLNTNLGEGSYKYVQTSNIRFGSGLMHSIDAGYPVICHVMTGALPHYDEYNTGHYVVATGYFWGQGGSTGGADSVTFNDPNWNAKYYGTYSCSWAAMTTAIDNNARYYIMGG